MITATPGYGAETSMSGYNIHIRALDMLNAFIGTPREKVKKMRWAITKHYSVDIGDPTQTGGQADYLRSLLFLPAGRDDIIMPENQDTVSSIFPCSHGFAFSTATQQEHNNYHRIGQHSIHLSQTTELGTTYWMGPGSESAGQLDTSKTIKT
ncbi:hypothetical protein ST47_g10590 [Ascochyta rabiei]|uniref:Uncharacterized protein n=1 Tax=Didymella rabiei TaxID=5454 RepID=A0A162V766_DIDRA|nr:hypothetical protein ST47_g10590 [Ascochyta rabiei]